MPPFLNPIIKMKTADEAIKEALLKHCPEAKFEQWRTEEPESLVYKVHIESMNIYAQQFKDKVEELGKENDSLEEKIVFYKIQLEKAEKKTDELKEDNEREKTRVKLLTESYESLEKITAEKISEQAEEIKRLKANYEILETRFERSVYKDFDKINELESELVKARIAIKHILKVFEDRDENGYFLATQDLDIAEILGSTVKPEQTEEPKESATRELLALYELNRDSGRDYSQMILNIEAKFRVLKVGEVEQTKKTEEEQFFNSVEYPKSIFNNQPEESKESGKSFYDLEKEFGNP